MGRTYTAAPIIGCVIEAQFLPPISHSAILRAATKLAKNYQNRADLEARSVRVNATTQQAEFGPPSPVITFSTADETERLVIQEGSFLVEQLAPYPGWEAFFARFERDWQILDKLAKRRHISRIGTRFINRLDMPVSVARTYPNKFVTIGITVPRHFANATSVGFNYQAEFGARPFKLILNSGLLDSPIPNMHAMTIDIDVIAEATPPQSTPDLLACLSEMRDVKNDIFEECVTDVARNTFA